MIITAIGLFHLDCFNNNKKSNLVIEKYLQLAWQVTVSPRLRQGFDN